MAKEPKKQNQKSLSKTAQRRRFILEEVRRRGQVSFKDIEKEDIQRKKKKEPGFPTGWQSLKTDDQVFENLGLPVRMQRRQGRFILIGRDVASIYEARKDEQKAQKSAIGQLSGALVWGTAASSIETLRRAFVTREAIKHRLEEYAHSDGNQYGLSRTSRNAAGRLCERLEQYWKKRHRYCAIDAGSTTTQTAEYLSTKRTPDKDAKLASLTVVTNAPPVEVALWDPSNTNIDVLSLGGFLYKDTRARAGTLCELGFDTWNIRVDVAIVGTTSLIVGDDERGRLEGFACDSADEARIKSLLLDRADIRCIVMDSTKFKRYRSSAFIFAPLSSEFVDLVITDEQIYSDDKNREAWQKLWNAGIVVLYSASSSESEQTEDQAK